MEIRRTASVDEKEPTFKSKKSIVDIKSVLKEHNFYDGQIEIDYVLDGEFTADKNKDLIFVSTSEDFMVILKGTAAGQYEFSQLVRTYEGPINPYAFDVNEDGVDELVVSHMKNKNSMIFAYNGEKMRYQHNLETGKYVAGFSLEKSDEKKSLVAVTYFSGSLMRFEHWAKVYFQRVAVESTPLVQKGIWFNHFDMDQDGRMDYVLSDFRGNKLLFVYGE